MEAAAPIAHSEDTVTLLDGRKLGYAEFGLVAGRPLLWFHGTPGGRYQIPPDLPEVAMQRGFRVIAVERPGSGESTHHKGRTLLSFTDDVEQLLDHLHIQEYALIGLSGGGPYVLGCAHEMPKRVVVGCSLGGMGPVCEDNAPPYWPVLDTLMRKLLPATEILGFLLGLLVKPAPKTASAGYNLYARIGPKSDRSVLRNPAIKAMFCRDIIHATKQGARAFAYDIAIFGQPWGFDTREIEVPIRIWHGDVDSVVPLSHSVYLQRNIEDCELQLVPGLGHFAGFVGIYKVLDEITAIWDLREQTATLARDTP